MKVDAKKCMRCGGCVAVCPVNCIELRDVIVFGPECTKCGICKRFCPMGAIENE